MVSEVAGFALIGFAVSLLGKVLTTPHVDAPISAGCYFYIGVGLSGACAGSSVAWTFLKYSALFGLVAVAELLAGALLGALWSAAVEPQTCATAAMLWPAWLIVGSGVAFGI